MTTKPRSRINAYAFIILIAAIAFAVVGFIPRSGITP